jgi:hypothetical protein
VGKSVPGDSLINKAPGPGLPGAFDLIDPIARRFSVKKKYELLYKKWIPLTTYWTNKTFYIKFLLKTLTKPAIVSKLCTGENTIQLFSEYRRDCSTRSTNN